jgi:hypothetical protein
LGRYALLYRLSSFGASRQLRGGNKLKPKKKLDFKPFFGTPVAGRCCVVGESHPTLVSRSFPKFNETVHLVTPVDHRIYVKLPPRLPEPSPSFLL